MTLKHFVFNKLIRDKAFDMMVVQGVDVRWCTLTNEERLARLKDKLQEEVLEVIEAKSHNELVEELGDLLEVIHAFAHTIKVPLSQIETARCEKFDYKGGFEKGIFVHKVALEASHPLATYYLNHPGKYPEITEE